MQNLAFYLKWIICNLIGFWAGSTLGATGVGLIPALFPGNFGLLVGDLIFGSMIGFFQWLVLRNHQGLTVSSWWFVLVGVGFTVGARFGALLTHRIVNEWFLAGIVFGCFMGGSIGLTTTLGFREKISWSRFSVWLITSILAWVAGESIAFASNFSAAAVPWVAVAISSINGIGLIWMWSSRPKKDDDVGLPISNYSD
jgi:hypothetical protein